MQPKHILNISPQFNKLTGGSIPINSYNFSRSPRRRELIYIYSTQIMTFSKKWIVIGGKEIRSCIIIWVDLVNPDYLIEIEATARSRLIRHKGFLQSEKQGTFLFSFLEDQVSHQLADIIKLLHIINSVNHFFYLPFCHILLCHISELIF